MGLSYTNSTPSGLSHVTKNLSEILNDFKGSAQLEVRIGYFGMCVRERGVLWLCSSDAEGLAQQIGPENDPLNLIGAGAKFKDDVLFSGLLFMSIVLAFICILLLATFPGWHKERDERTGSEVDVKPFPSRPVSMTASSQAIVSALLLLIASLWQHIGSVGAAAVAESANYGNVKSAIGAGAMSLAWTAFVLETIVAIGLGIMVQSIFFLDKGTNND